jgi:uncharacterized YigZ family protein
MVSDSYPVPARIHRVEEVITRSRFLTTLAHAPDAQAAKAFVQRIRDELPDATHHCWAFVAGAPGSTRSVGMSDAGEPAGTAGKPMLVVLLHSGIGEIVAVSSRWYGGTKLGTGGLARAYAGGVKLALESLPTEFKVPRVLVEVAIEYHAVDTVLRALEDLDAITVESTYGSGVVLIAQVPESALSELGERVARATAGEGTVRRV